MVIFLLDSWKHQLNLLKRPSSDSTCSQYTITPFKRTYYGRSGTPPLQGEERDREERLEAAEERREERRQANKKSKDMMAMMMTMLVGNRQAPRLEGPKRHKLGLNSSIRLYSIDKSLGCHSLVDSVV